VERESLVRTKRSKGTNQASGEPIEARVVEIVMGENSPATGTTSITRRRFVADGAVLALFLAVPQSLRVPPGTPVLVRSTFAPLVGATFRMIGGGVKDDAVLTKVADIAPVRGPDDQVCFALYFDTAARVPRNDGIYSFGHQRIGSLPLFVTAVRRRGAANTFEAVIDRRLFSAEPVTE
jgi:hypothetical protein